MDAKTGTITIDNSKSFYSIRDFIVRIDGQKKGRARRGARTEFSVDSGEHTVVVSIDGIRSPPQRVVVTPGSRTALEILRGRGRWKFMLFLAIAAFGAPLLNTWLRSLMLFGETFWQTTAVFLGVFAVVFGCFFVASSYLGESWALYTLEPVKTDASPTAPAVT